MTDEHRRLSDVTGRLDTAGLLCQMSGTIQIGAKTTQQDPNTYRAEVF